MFNNPAHVEHLIERIALALERYNETGDEAHATLDALAKDEATALLRIATALETIANRLPATATDLAASAAQAGADGWMEGWNEHHGDPWVVSGDMLVDARLRDGQILTERAKHLSWTYSRGSDSPSNVISWKLHTSKGTDK